MPRPIFQQVSRWIKLFWWAPWSIIHSLMYCCNFVLTESWPQTSAGCIVPSPWSNPTRTFIALCGGLLSMTVWRLLHDQALSRIIQFGKWATVKWSWLAMLHGPSCFDTQHSIWRRRWDLSSPCHHSSWYYCLSWPILLFHLTEEGHCVVDTFCQAH